MTTLVIAAHPDDETLGCGATIARRVAEGENVHVLVLGQSRVPPTDLIAACKRLGTSNVSQWVAPDQKFDTLPLLAIVEQIEAHIALTNPDVVYTHHPGDLNLDHVLTARATLTALRPPNRATIYTYEVPSSTDWAYGQYEPFIPNTWVEISDLDAKLEAIALYPSEVRLPPHPRSRIALIELAGARGSQVGVYYAEAFRLVRATR